MASLVRASAAGASSSLWTVVRTSNSVSSYMANSNSVTTPKFPPPPRIPQKRSGWSSGLARTTSPSAVTTSADRRLSIVRPNRRISRPTPPPNVGPPTPVCETTPEGTHQPVFLCCLIDLSEQRSSADLHAPALRIGAHRVQVSQVEHQPVIAGAIARHAVASPSHGHREIVPAYVLDRCDNVLRSSISAD
jgi:hypothetical protein